jgi:hypothetical protein
MTRAIAGALALTLLSAVPAASQEVHLIGTSSRTLLDMVDLPLRGFFPLGDGPMTLLDELDQIPRLGGSVSFR